RGSSRGDGYGRGTPAGLQPSLHRDGRAGPAVRRHRQARRRRERRRLLMLLHLLRHADAGDPQAWQGPDSIRPLSAKGRRQSKRLGDHLSAAGFKTDVIVTSPKIRAEQTADIVGERLGVAVTVDDRLADPLDVDIVDDLLTDAGDPE